RSPYAHARFEIRNVSAAAAHPGVHLILTAEETRHLKPIECQTLATQPDGSVCASRDLPILCEEIVRHVGDAIAFVVAESIDIARDASELIEVDYQMIDAVAGTAEALEDTAPLVYEDAGTNLAFTIHRGDIDATKSAFSRAEHVTEITVINNRLVCNYIEPRACIATWEDEEDRWSLHVGSQGVHGIRDQLAKVFGVGKDKFRVRTGDVGGGFGTKAFAYREYPLAMEAANRLGRPVKWKSDRSEHFVADVHGRDNIATAKMAMDANGKFLAIEVDLLAAMGAYLHCYGPFIPTLGVSMTTGVYDIPAMFCEIKGVYSNTTPTDAYRGAGRPEAAYLIERLVDKCAKEMGLSREEIRRRNFVRPDQMPYLTPGKRQFDTGEFDGHMTQALERSKWSDFEVRAAEARERGKIRGIGMATFIEACAFAGSEAAFLELQKDGHVTLKIGTQTNGQGHATAYAQLAGEKLGLDYEQIEVLQGDTDELESGGGTGGSRSVPLGGVSAVRASELLAEKISRLAADQLEASPADIELTDGQARIAGTDRFVSFADLANSAKNPDDLKADADVRQGEATYPNGTHICEVEIDPETGTTKIVAYTIVDDYGVTVNPILLAGQIHGGIVQGIGQCLNEHTVYDDEGQLITASFMDYSMPLAQHVPSFDFETRNVPSTTNALGIKGAGEAGTIGACPAVMNAVVHALNSEYGIDHIDMPAIPSKVWEVINASRK
ncbi:MAG: xanthine dehydrogenase family protein molybdopterin-binding subunit, partial [Rhizobiaceae bacterium]